MVILLYVSMGEPNDTGAIGVACNALCTARCFLQIRGIMAWTAFENMPWTMVCKKMSFHHHPTDLISKSPGISMEKSTKIDQKVIGTGTNCISGNVWFVIPLLSQSL